MEDLVKALVSAPANAVLLLAGIAFLAVAIFGRITEHLDPGPRGRIAAGGLGAVLVAVSLYLSFGGEQQSASSPAVAPASAPAETEVSATAPLSPEPTGQAVSSATPTYPVALAAGQVVKGEERTYTILRTELDRHEIDRLALAVTLRMQNDSNYPANFWNESFRLMVDGWSMVPIGDLNELVEAHAAKEGTVTFALPKEAKAVALQIDRFGANAPGIAIALPAER